MGPPEYTLEAVNEIVPKLAQIVGRQLERRARIEQLLLALGERLGEVPERVEPDPADPPDVRQLKRDIAERVAVYQSAWHELDEIGAVLKDPRIGLVDFYGRVNGKLVWLCWRYGEDEVRHYHELDQGFSARKPIATDVRRHQLN